MANKIIHKRSSVVTDGVAKLPNSSDLEYGELAINFGSGAETISLKNSDDEIVEFKTHNYYESIIKENEFITATALTDLDDRTTALENLVQSDDFVTQEDLDNKVDNDVFTTRIATLESVVEDNEFVTAGSLSDLNKRITNVDEKVENCVSNDTFQEFTDAYEEDELVIAAAFTTLDEKVAEVEEVFDTYVNTTAPNTFATQEQVESVLNLMDEDGLVVATALADLDNRIICVEGADKGKSIRQIANEELIQQLIPEDAQISLDTLQEIASWIQEHPEDAAAMNEAIASKVGNDVFQAYTGTTAPNTFAAKEHTHEQYLTEHQDISHLIDNEEFNTYSGTTAPSMFAAKEHTHEQYITNTTFEDFKDAYEEDELIIAAALTTLETRMNEEFVTNTEFESFQSIIDKDNLVVATSLTDLNNRMISVEGTDKGKSIRQIANEELIQQLIPADAQASLDTLQEIAAWIQEHPEDAAAMNEAIASKVGNDVFDTYTGTTAPNTFAAKEHTHEQYTTNTAFEEFKEEVNKDARVIATALTTLDTKMNEDKLGVAASLTDLSNRLEDIANNEYYDDGSGKLVPIKHPDLSTQPNILPYKFMGEYVYEILLPIPDIDISKSTYNVNASQLLEYVEDNYAVTILQAEELLFCYKEGVSPYPSVPMFMHRNISIYTNEIYGGTSVYDLVVQPDKTYTNIEIGDVVMAYLKITYTSMPKEGGDYYGYNNY